MLANIPWNRNVLANFAPRPSGEMPASVYRCLADVQTWMAGHRESVVGVDPGHIPTAATCPSRLRRQDLVSAPAAEDRRWSCLCRQRITSRSRGNQRES